MPRYFKGDSISIQRRYYEVPNKRTYTCVLYNPLNGLKRPQITSNGKRQTREFYQLLAIRRLRRLLARPPALASPPAARFVRPRPHHGLGGLIWGRGLERPRTTSEVGLRSRPRTASNGLEVRRSDHPSNWVKTRSSQFLASDGLG